METENLLTKVAKILGGLDIPYLVTGGIAVATWGRVRATLDIDIVIEIEESKISQLVKALKKLSKSGYIDEAMARTALENEGEFNFIDPSTGLKVDFWIKKNELFSKNEFDRKIPKNFGDQKVYFICPEDLIIEKLRWYKLGESSKHLEDIESVFKISKVDLVYIKKWVIKDSTIDILEDILKKL